MGDVTVLVPFDFINSVLRTSQKTLLSFDSHIIHCIVAVLQFFADENIGAQKYHFEFVTVFLNVLLFPIH